MDEDLFELQYADELDALDDNGLFDEPEDTPKSRRNLQFITPNSKTKSQTHCQSNTKFIGSTNEGDVQETPDVESSCLSVDLINPHDELNNTIQFEDEVDGETAVETEWALSDSIANIGVNHLQKKRVATETDLLNTEASEFFDSLPDIEPLPKRARTSAIDASSDDDSSFPFSPSMPQTGRKKTLQGQQSGSGLDSTDVLQKRLYDERETDCRRQRIFHAVPRGDFVFATSSEGQRVYLKLKDKTDMEEEIDGIGQHTRSLSAILPVSVRSMREQLEEERHERLLQNPQEFTQSVRREQEEDQGLGDIETEEEDNSSLEALWVERYAPQHYTDLLSEEAINRMLLHWLKQWDYVVFGKELPLVKDKEKGKVKDTGNSKWKKLKPEVSTELDDFKRPLQKVTLLCGPPGLGKTTLAHIVARHAGYNVVEMNASDDRSVEVFTNKIEATTQMRSMMGADPRPNCLVIDEIDGAPQAAINVLLAILRRPEADRNTGNKKKKTEGNMLLRPVICICNDQYTQALRQLRQQALILTFPPTDPSRLASRLSEVVRQEKLKADLNTLLALCERTENDIRSCLNTLQFIHRRQKELSVRTVQTMSIGQKDSHKSLFAVWKEIFTMPRPKRNRFVSIFDLSEGRSDSLQQSASSPTARFQHILNLAQATGEYERVIQGLYENYLQAKSKDPHLLGLNLSAEWLCFVDSINQYTHHRQDYSLMKYVPFLHVAFHMVYASFVPPRISFPHVQFEVHQTLTKINNLLASLMADMSPAIRKFVTHRALTFDLLPHLLDILQPTLRPVNTQLYSSREKEELAHLVHIMINYNMTYRQERSQEGQYIYVLDPNMEEVIRFSGLKQRRQLTYGAKQLISREIELEKMRRNEAANFSSFQASTKVPNHKQTLDVKPVKEEKPRTDYFSQFTRIKRQKTVIFTEVDKEEKVPEKNVLDTLIWFHFKEGYSNAVRRNVKMQDLI